MYKDVLRSIEGIEIFPVISFIIFFFFFLGLLLYVFSMKKNWLKEMENMPLEDEQPMSQSLNNNHNE